MIETPEQKVVDAVIASRRSLRAFLPTPVAREDVEAILEIAARAPSGTNTQPWKAYVLTGGTKEKLSSEILRAYNDPEIGRQHTEEYHYYPSRWTTPFLERRRKVGWDLYSLLGITRENKAGMHAQLGRNYRFFGAPVGIIFTIDRVLEQGSWLDYGMFLQNVMLAARARGLDTCPQAAFAQFHRIVRDVLQIPANEMVVCGMSLGFADESKIENTLVTERVSVSEFAKFMD
ncbi:nitroreductase [Noviherbaspirillum sp.]|uniref:nitroreductase n=1 Tax=Noviherbaspirillum sp. TaxID=1926288 RepID=UPI002B4A1393|nr:nitroreductase [Noviherbaspirillum sp.]HJV82253.1 nitroreductase [Noviherbaspirillum sp.]